METENIFELTKENLIKCGFDSDVIEQLLSQNSKETVTKNKLETFVASTIDNKIYTTKEAYRKMYFKNELDPEFPVHYLGLIPEYYELAESNFLKASEKRLTFIYNEETEKQNFKKDELKDCIIEIDRHFNQQANQPKRHRTHHVIAGKQAYKTWLEREQQSEPKAQKRLPAKDYALQAQKADETPKELFKPTVVNPQQYIDILKNLKPPILNNKNEFIKGVNSKNKTPIVAWHDVLEKHGLFLAGGIDRTNAINKEIYNLEISNRSFGNMTDKYNNYYTEITALLNKLLT